MSYTREDWKAARAAVDAIYAERKALLAPTEERYDAALERMEEITDNLGDTEGTCEGCSEPVFEGEPYTYDPDGEPYTAETAAPIIAGHIASGGTLTDSMATPRTPAPTTTDGAENELA